MWYYRNSGDKTHEVKKKRPTSLRLYDISGNVSEWCWDWFIVGDYMYDRENIPVTGSESGTKRTYRAISFRHNVSDFYITNRYSGDPYSRWSIVGTK